MEENCIFVAKKKSTFKKDVKCFLMECRSAISAYVFDIIGVYDDEIIFALIIVQLFHPINAIGLSLYAQICVESWALIHNPLQHDPIGMLMELNLGENLRQRQIYFADNDNAMRE